MLNRRQMLGTALAVGSTALAGTARAQAWKAKYPELVLGGRCRPRTPRA